MKKILSTLALATLLVAPAFAQDEPAAPAAPATPGQGRHHRKDRVGRLDRGIKHLEACHKILDGMAGTEYGGHRAAAEKAIDQALQELQAAKEYAESHPNDVHH